MGQQNALQQQQAQQQQETAENEVVAFGENAEFLADVRMDMADLIDMASKRGQSMTMQDAYNKACVLNPQIQAVLQQRQQHKQLTGNSNTMANKRLAGSSITGNRGGGGAGGSGGSMRDTISNAWDNQDKI
jgi:hypothetical protein